MVVLRRRAREKGEGGERVLGDASVVGPPEEKMHEGKASRSGEGAKVETLELTLPS